MPIFTFACQQCGAEVERICKPVERIHQECQCGALLTWAGVEGSQAHRLNGKFEMKAVLPSGQKVPIDHQRAKRSDS